MTMSCERKNDTSSSKDITFESETFTESGTCDDEVTLEFESDKKLYVSKNFLRYASPVFEAMFTHDWKEGKESCIKLKGKKFDDFLEFLHCIHPRILKPITKQNVLQIVDIGNEYQVTSVVTKCNRKMMAWLKDSLQEAKSTDNHYLNQAVYLRPCLLIIAKAHELNYNNVVNSAAKTIAKFGHILYNEPATTSKENKERIYRIGGEPSPFDKKGDETLGEIREKCMRIFNELPLEIKFNLLSERLLCLSGDKTKLL